MTTLGRMSGMGLGCVKALEAKAVWPRRGGVELYS
jgi:hypothetical protein